MLLRRVRPGVEVVELSQLSGIEREVAERGEPEFFCLDLKLPDTVGVSGVKYLKAQFPDVPLVVISASPAEDAEEWCRVAGADLYIEKSAGASEMTSVLRSIMVVDSQLGDLDDSTGELGFDARLSKRQKQLIVMLDQGLSNREIADQLFLSRYTVESHVKRIYRKLAVSSRISAVSVARARGVIG